MSRPEGVEKHLVVDCDPGCDDALALLLAFANADRVDVLTVAGNVGINQTTANAARICALFKRYVKNHLTDIRIYRGASRSLAGVEPSAASVHGRDGLGDVPLRALVDDAGVGVLREVSRKVGKERLSAVGRLMQVVRGSERHKVDEHHKVDLVCIGPLTNLAMAVSLYDGDAESFWKPWRRIVFMVGALSTPGNVSDAAEFNAYADADALGIVLRSLALVKKREGTREETIPIIVPLDVTEKIRANFRTVRPAACGGAEGTASKLALCTAVKRLLAKYMLFHALHYPGSDEDRKRTLEAYETARRGGGAGWSKLPRSCFLHDALAVWTAINHPKNWLERKLISVDTSDGAGRGRTSVVAGREVLRFSSNEASSRRADAFCVRVLEPQEEAMKELRTQFLKAVYLAIGAEEPKHEERGEFAVKCPT